MTVTQEESPSDVLLPGAAIIIGIRTLLIWAIVAAVMAFVCVFGAVLAPWLAPHNPFDLATLELSNARLPPAWSEGGPEQGLT